MLENKESHPSYATLQFSRVHGSSTNLFGSSIKHKDTISMRVRNATISRNLNNDFIMGEDEIIECEMSYSQFAEAITSMNQGTGVPVTLRFHQGEGRIEECPFIDKRTQIENEFEEQIDKANEKINTLIKEVSDLFSDKKNIGKADREEILKKLLKVQQEVGSNSKFVYSQFNEQMDKTTMEAKGEIEAFMQNKINSIANINLVEYKEEFKKIENPIEY